MSETKIQLQITSILSVPIDSYSKDFMFIVNGEEFQTTKIISDLLSPKISQIHKIDPTFDTYTILTRNRGNFSSFLRLINFSEETIPNNDLPFLLEILDISIHLGAIQNTILISLYYFETKICIQQKRKYKLK